MSEQNKWQENRFLYLTTLFVTLLVVANIVSAKVIDLWGMLLPAAVIGYPFTYLLTDAISELYGEKRAKQVVYAGFCANLLMLLFVQATIHLPAAAVWPNQEAYETIMSSSLRTVIASLLSYFVAQMVDVKLFHAIKKRTGEGKFWLRKNVSTLISQLLDTAIFIVVAFAATMPTSALLQMILFQYLVKTAIAMIDTPLSYMLVKRMKQTAATPQA
ncbi:queuosine precursor transporter [Brevibacillus fulvus]|uniref:Probable queuosine precursor transporter n=1 Tax=Brevibacillus fulvus TaxID=1125967 RepID=A0A938XUJ7_9BACL|nr:putative integral membrane protein (TIGR00697 family) [Brevibacillus fulvus]